MEKPERMDEPTVFNVPDDKSVKVTMTFYRPEHDTELRQAMNAGKYLHVLWDLDQWLRNEVKHGDDEQKMDRYDEVRTRLHEILEYEGVNLDEEMV